MTKTLIDVDDDLLLRAQEALGAGTKKETVDLALAEVIAAVARRREIERLDAGVYVDLADSEVMRKAWG